MSRSVTVWTVGHSNQEFDRLIELLRSELIKYVLDVRSYPFSKFVPHFNRDELEMRLPASGIGYLFLGEELGGRPSQENHYDSDGHALYGSMAQTAAFRKGIERVTKGAKTHRVALLCSEADPTDCHRRLLVGRVLTSEGCRLRHILHDGTVREETQVRLGESLSQPTMFDEDITWRSTQSVSHRQRPNTSSGA